MQRISSLHRSSSTFVDINLVPLPSSTNNNHDGGEERHGIFFLVLFCAIATANYIDRGALNGALTNVKEDLCLSTTQEGLVVSARGEGQSAPSLSF